MEIDKELLKEMPFLNITFKIEKDFTNIDQKTKDGHDWAARVMVGHGKKIGAKLVSLAHSSFLEEGFLQQSPWTKGSRDYVISNDKSGEWHTRKINVKELLEKTHLIESLLQTLLLYFLTRITQNKKLLHITEISILVVSNDHKS